ncbi:Rieske (2Fe-2S) protein [Dehalogenimonas etheniformans]|uniref:Ferredoxin n=1 Tax=Dehalogenimonas etheniformans TaxID=1536648 RepID=A0A2P5P5P8_9CHLR|nr:Rieske 2Fe-2S domain-containing protein [Dehalogenimonas etheniformans]PPD57626.1 ferredoxin [Dehalogenimonas etheniformans]QNT75967.1 Rieske 2Fe-2S domain-containing protein [Dehalogenimonas etheniformans]
MEKYIDVAKTGDILDGQMKSFLVCDKKLLVINSSGNFYAINETCSHLGGELASGKLEGKVISCPIHGAKFYISSGKCLSGFKFGPFKLRTKDACIFPVVVEGEAIKVRMEIPMGTGELETEMHHG